MRIRLRSRYEPRAAAATLLLALLAGCSGITATDDESPTTRIGSAIVPGDAGASSRAREIAREERLKVIDSALRWIVDRARERSEDPAQSGAEPAH